jgi:hypothetical protein
MFHWRNKDLGRISDLWIDEIESLTLKRLLTKVIENPLLISGKTSTSSSDIYDRMS